MGFKSKKTAQKRSFCFIKNGYGSYILNNLTLSGETTGRLWWSFFAGRYDFLYVCRLIMIIIVAGVFRDQFFDFANYCGTILRLGDID
jgi:hypothetical protein